MIAAGDLVNIDVSACKNGTFAGNGATFCMGSFRPSLKRLCSDGKRAMQVGIAQVGHDKSLAGIGNVIGRFAQAEGIP